MMTNDTTLFNSTRRLNGLRKLMEWQSRPDIALALEFEDQACTFTGSAWDCVYQDCYRPVPIK